MNVVMKQMVVLKYVQTPMEASLVGVTMAIYWILTE